MKRKEEVPGDARESLLRFQEEQLKLAATLYRLDTVVDRYWDDDVVITSIRFRVPQTEGQEWLAIVNARQGDTPLVAFHSSLSFPEAARGVIARLDNGSLHFKEDKREF